MRDTHTGNTRYHRAERRLSLVHAAITLIACAAIGACGQMKDRTMPRTPKPLTITVTPDGARDTRTLTEARDLIREWKAEGRDLSSGVVVRLKAGTYRLSETLRFTAEDSGTEDAPVVYRAADGAKVRITGAYPVTGWEPWRDGILRANVRDLGVAELDAKSTDPVQRIELFFRHRRMELARWPNRVADDPYAGEWAYIHRTPEEETKTEFTIHTEGERMARWMESPEAQVHIFARYDWRDDYVGIAEADTATQTIQLADPTSYTIAAGRRFYVRNVLSELDAPGEWYLDAESATLYFLPPDTMGDGDVEVSSTDNLIEFDGASHITVQSIVIDGSRSDAVRIDGGSGIVLAGCTIRNTGGYAVDLAGGTNHRVAGCDIHDTGLGGVKLGGGDRITLTPGGNAVENCHIYRFSQLRKTYNPGVLLNGVGNRVAHNLMHDAPHTAILLHGNNHLIEYNRIHDVVQETQDAGAFYMGRNWTERGNVIRYNIFHDLYGYGFASGDADLGYWMYESPRGVWAVYLDDNASGTTVYGNLFYRCPLGAVHLGGGKDNVIENNIISECYPAIHVDARWENFFAPDSLGGVNDYMRGHLAEVNYQQPPYSERYPNLVGVLDEQRVPARNRIVRNVAAYRLDDVAGFWNMEERPNSARVWELSNFDPVSTEIDSNVVWHYGAPARVFSQHYLDQPSSLMEWNAWQASGFDRNSVVADPKFLDPAADDYALAEDSPAHALGFEPIPWERIGPYKDPLRASWPLKIDACVPRRTSVERQVTVHRMFDMETTGDWRFVKRFCITGPFPLLWTGLWTGFGSDRRPQRPDGFDFAYPPEKAGMRNPVATFQTVDGDARWQSVERDSLGYLDLGKYFKTTDNVIAYAYVRVFAPEAMQTRLSLGSNDGARVWVNGELVIDVNVGRAAKPHQNVVPVELRKGRNTILVKVSNIGGAWGLYLALEDRDRVLTYGVDW